LLSKFAEHVAIRRRVAGVATHPEDDPILATALSARADYLVTGDLRLQRRVPTFQGIPLVLAADFLDILNREP
jgi:predicted nucleic acid-binding protein